MGPQGEKWAEDILPPRHRELAKHRGLGPLRGRWILGKDLEHSAKSLPPHGVAGRNGTAQEYADLDQMELDGGRQLERRAESAWHI